MCVCYFRAKTCLQVGRHPSFFDFCVSVCVCVNAEDIFGTVTLEPESGRRCLILSCLSWAGCFSDGALFSVTTVTVTVVCVVCVCAEEVAYLWIILLGLHLADFFSVDNRYISSA